MSQVEQALAVRSFRLTRMLFEIASETVVVTNIQPHSLHDVIIEDHCLKLSFHIRHGKQSLVFA
jgi:hypothetical protein